MRNSTVGVLGLTLALLVGRQAVADILGYTATSTPNSVVYFTNFTTGEQIPLGPSGINQIAALEYVNGTLYATGGTGGTRELWEIDTKTGAGSKIGDTERLIRNLAATSDGELYGNGWIWDPELLLEVDTTTGVDTSVGSLFPYIGMTAFAIDGDDRGIGWDDGAQWLFEIDLSDGSTSSFGPLAGDFDAFDYGPGGVLYAWDGSRIYSVDIESVSVQVLQTFSIGARGFTLIPEPTTLALVCFGLTLIAMRRRR